MKKLIQNLFLLLLLIAPLGLFAQIEVTATGGILSQNYSNLSNAFTAINNGTHSGDIIISVNANTINTFTILNASGTGFSHYFSIKIIPGVIGQVNVDLSFSSPMFWLNGVDNLTIDGTLPGGYGPITFRNTVPNSSQGTLHFYNDAQNDTVRNCRMEGNGGYCIAITSPATTGGNKNLVFSGNNIGNYSSSAFPQYGIYSTASSDSISITDNYFHDIVSQGNLCGSIFLNGSEAANWKINNNHIYYSTSVTAPGFTQIYGIYTAGTSNTCEIKNNIIGFSDTSKTSPAVFSSTGNLTFTGISSGATTNGTYIKNNIIDGFDFSTASGGTGFNGSWCGISLAVFYTCYVDSNRIGKTTGSESIKIRHTNLHGFATGMSFTGGNGTHFVRNNSIGSIEVISTSNNIMSRFFAMNFNAPSTFNVQNNIIGDSSTIATPNSITVGTTTATILNQFAAVNVEANNYPAINMTSNVIRNCRTRTNSDSTLCAGIKTNGSANSFTIVNNTIKDLEALSSSTGSSKVYGILYYNTSFTANTVKRNQISNLNSICGTGNRSNSVGIYTSGNPTVDSNIIHDISTNSSTIGITGGALGIYSTGNANYNRIYNIVNTNATVDNIYAVGIHSTGFDNRRNMIYDIKTQTSYKSTVEGIRISNNGGYLIANVISLGTGITTDPVIKAIHDSSANPTKLLAFNSIYIGGTQSSNTSNTMCYYNSISTFVQIYNNIFYNTRGSTGSPGGLTGRHYVLNTTLNSFSSNFALSYNNCTADDNGGTFAGTSSSYINTLADFKTVTNGLGQYCFSSDPEFINPANSPPDLTLPMNNKQSNGGSRLNSFFYTDFNGNARPIPSTNRPDIGAFEADYGDPTVDLQEPYISISQLPQDLASNMTRTLTNFTFISDNKSLSNSNPPRIYFKRTNDPNANLPVATNTSTDPMGWRYNSGTTSDAGTERTYSFTIDYSLMNSGSSLTGDSTFIQYFLAAEDATGNLGSNAFGANAGTPPVNVTSQPTATILSYRLRLGVQGTYYIKGGGTPLFNSFYDFCYYYNTGIITGDVTAVIGGDIYGRDVCLLTNQSNVNGSNYKITIRPDGNTLRTFENVDTSFNQHNIYLYDINNLTIDGRDPNTGTGKYLRFINNSDEPVQSQPIVDIYYGVNKTTIRNCIFESNGANIISFSSYGGATGNDSNIISNCDFRPSSGTYPGRYQTGVKFGNQTTLDSMCNGNIVDSCDFVDFNGNAIYVDKAASNSDMRITNNKFHQSFNYGAFITAVRFQGYGTNLIANNEIYDTYTNQSVVGFSIGDARNTTIAGNKINITPSSTPNYLYGIYLISYGTFTNVNIINNQITIDPTGNGNTPIYGIYDYSSGQTVNMHYNTVYIGGQSSGTTNTYCAYRENPLSNSSSWNVQNNIFYNNRTAFSETAQHYVIGNNNLDYGMSTNYNFFVGKSTGFFDDLFFDSRGTGVALQTWKLQSFNRDANSTFKVANTMNANNFFQSISNGNLSIKTNYVEANYINGMGTPVTSPSVTTDINGNARSSSYAGGCTDIGSCEITTPSVEPAPINLVGPFNIGTEYFFFENGRIYGSIIFNSAVQPSSLAMTYYPGTNPPNAHNTFGNSYYKIIATGTNSGLDYDIKLAFDDRETNNITQPVSNSLGLAKRSDDSVDWNPLPGSIYDNVSYAGAIARNMTSFSLFAFTDNTNPLPVELAEFSSTVNKNDVKLKWITTSEINSSKFEIERKLSASNEWLRIGSVAAAGNSTQLKDYSYEDRKLTAGKYKYRLKQIDLNGNYEYFDLRNEIEVGIPKDFKLSQNYPNPFNPVTKIDYDIPFDAKVEIRVYDVTGREMNVLVNMQQTAGYYTVQFNGSNFASGTYFYRIAAKSTTGKDFSKTLKMILVK